MEHQALGTQSEETKVNYLHAGDNYTAKEDHEGHVEYEVYGAFSCTFG